MAVHISTIPQIVRPKDAAKQLGISHATFWRIVKRGDLSTIKITDRATGVLQSELDAFIKARTVGAETIGQ